MVLFFNAEATTGTKGGEQIADTDVIKKVSVSILNNRQKMACRINVATSEEPIKIKTVKSIFTSTFISVKEATERQKT